MDILNDLYELVCRSSATRLKNGTMMSTLLSCTSPGELETRKRQKYEGILEDMKNVCHSQSIFLFFPCKLHVIPTFMYTCSCDDSLGCVVLL